MRLIDADALGLDINRKAHENFPANRNLTLYAESLLAHAPTIDAVPVVHGRWEYHDCVCTGNGLAAVYACSNCHFCIDEEVFDCLTATGYSG